MGKSIGAMINPGGALVQGGTGLIGMARANKATDRAARHQTAATREAQLKLNPYLQSGEQANTMLQDKLSSGDLGGTFTPGNLTEDPGYQFNLEQGEQALRRKSTAPGGGGYFSGQALKEAQQFGQGLADQTYNDAYNRWLGEQGNTYDMLSGQQGLGYGAAQDYGNLSQTIGQIAADRVIDKENQRMKGYGGFLSGLGASSGATFMN